MQIQIFAEDSDTIADNIDLPIVDYYKGLFGIVTRLYEEMAEIADTRLHVLSEEFGMAEGHEIRSKVHNGQSESSGYEKMVDSARKKIFRTAENADVMIILLSSEVFQATIGEVWEELVQEANPDSVWCLGAAESALQSIDTEDLEEKGCTVIVYRRAGVARIGNETRRDLLETVKRKASE